jgi:hypothetical protein
LIFVAASTLEAEKVELVLTENEIDYTLMEIPFSSLLSLSERPGIGFYVISGQADYCRNILSANNIKTGVWPEDIDTGA